ncbi:OmpH family outer membrane protein [Niabella drilacis]|uniref:Periplasmic chaperone for outer membrane proteins Skp n=1 Tax=Niabella drilacis (strain DSM 25811 / CCM 8410 / CCUG 62505 / LMG 26954 / E90) TaxID=1285928 RepID=A0A1G6Q7X6_NIADE|nr:OmpH family outer membrane protein [Niabella drilacis]SDC88580.1 periplasmic chaperone for outer membrane proteins Skp [Niabella drilacis]
MKRIKFLALALGMVIASGSMVSAQKIGTADLDALIANLPEFQGKQQQLQQFYQDSIGGEYEQLYKEFVDKDSAMKKATSPSVKATLEKEVGTLQRTLQGWQDYATQRNQAKQAELFGPLVKKAQDALNAVAKEKGYTYVLQPGAFLVMPPADDLTMAIAEKLGIKPAGAPGAAPAGGAPKPAAKPAAKK